MYLEFHRGTYTSQAKNKKYNRICEFMMADAEFYSVLANGLGNGYEYPEKELEKNWKLLLLNQFHDILPGSSIKDVYETQLSSMKKSSDQPEELQKGQEKPFCPH